VEVDVAVDADLDRFEREYLATLDDDPGIGMVDRTPDILVTVGADGVCTVDATRAAGGLAAMELHATGDGVAAVVGRLAPGHTAADIAALFAAGAVTAAPEWFEQLATAQPEVATLLDLEPDEEYTVVCVADDGRGGIALIDAAAFTT
jgi:hypothetical protein